MNLTKLVFNIFMTGATLLCAGILGEMVLDLQKKAAHDTAIGIISISTWNERLTSRTSEDLPSNARNHPRKRLSMGSVTPASNEDDAPYFHD